MTRLEPLAVLAHELRNPVGAIRNALTVMESAGQLPGAMDRARRLIASQAAQLSVLVEDLLDLASFSRGTLTLRREWIDLVGETEAAVESCAWELNACGHTFCVDLPEVPLNAYIDGARLRQVITNLLDNACKYTPSFGQIRLTLAQAGDYAVFSVEDNGVGIASDSARDAIPRGLGIGLTLVRAIVELHGGEVQVRSDGAGLGSTFCVRLPLCSPPGASAQR